MPNVFGIVDNILIVEYDADGRYHNRTLRQVMHYAIEKFQTKEKEISFQNLQDTILWISDI